MGRLIALLVLAGPTMTRTSRRQRLVNPPRESGAEWALCLAACVAVLGALLWVLWGGP